MGWGIADPLHILGVTNKTRFRVFSIYSCLPHQPLCCWSSPPSTNKHGVRFTSLRSFFSLLLSVSVNYEGFNRVCYYFPAGNGFTSHIFGFHCGFWLSLSSVMIVTQCISVDYCLLTVYSRVFIVWMLIWIAEWMLNPYFIDGSSSFSLMFCCWCDDMEQ